MIRAKRWLFLTPVTLVFFTLTGCSTLPKLTCRSEYLYPTYLASVQVNTPDPDGICFFGQQVIVYWNIPTKCLKEPLFLHFTVRAGTREIETKTTPIESKKGYWAYRLINQDYWCHGGIVSFKAEIKNASGEVLQDWIHSLWAEIIEISPDN